MKKKKVGVVGSIGDSADGQTIKTMTLIAALRRETNWKIVEVNTQERNRNPIKLFFCTIHMLLHCKDVFILVSRNGAKFFFPIFFFFAKIFKTKVYHDAIGNCAVNYAHSGRRHVKYLNSFKVNWVETFRMLEDLRNAGVNNVEQLYNFKDLKIINENQLKEKFTQPYPLCTFSRVIKEKGIEDAICAVEEFNKKNNKIIFSLDIYGAIDEGYKNDFYKIIKSSHTEICYKGVVPFNKSIETIQNYFALLFPTYWDGEGFPGTIIDALFSGVPIVATDWMSNSELIRNNYTGIIYPNKNINDLFSALMWMSENITKMIEMRKYCLLDAKQYEASRLINKIIGKVEECKK